MVVAAVSAGWQDGRRGKAKFVKPLLSSSSRFAGSGQITLRHCGREDPAFTRYVDDGLHGEARRSTSDLRSASSCSTAPKLYSLARSGGMAERACTCQNGTTLVSKWCKPMPTTLTLKNIPDAVYERLKSAAEMHRRSLNSEAIVCLEAVLLPTRLAPSERIARARELRAALPKQRFTHDDIDAAKREGRA